ncbi:MAG: hypothetical protein KKB51_09435 [Candidatus Riflebacteria bacterium]|nr:hypothetical protein [Candidatus Riflebacteria bacterium]
MLKALLREAVITVRENYRDRIVVIYHNDADGISSGYILKTALMRAGFQTEIFCLEKLYPEALKVLFQKKGVFIIGDLGSAFTKLLSHNNFHHNQIIILDHHQVLHETSDEKILLVNPEKCGYSGSTDISGAGVCYLFALELDPDNYDLCPIAMVGNSELPGTFQSLSREILNSGIMSGVIRDDETSDEGSYEILLPDKEWYSLPEIFKVSDTLGTIGYYQEGFNSGIELFEFGYTEALRCFYRKLDSEKNECFQRALACIEKNGYKNGADLIWFDAKDIFAGMGNKVIGLFLSEWKKMLPENLCVYILGMMNLEKEIPGIGVIAHENKKVSGRLSERMQKMVLADRMLPLSEIFAKAAASVGGFGDGHKVASSAVIPRNKILGFVRFSEKMIKDFEER